MTEATKGVVLGPVEEVRGECEPDSLEAAVFSWLVNHSNCPPDCDVHPKVVPDEVAPRAMKDYGGHWEAGECSCGREALHARLCEEPSRKPVAYRAQLFELCEKCEGSGQWYMMRCVCPLCGMGPLPGHVPVVYTADEGTSSYEYVQMSESRYGEIARISAGLYGTITKAASECVAEDDLHEVYNTLYWAVDNGRHSTTPFDEPFGVTEAEWALYVAITNHKYPPKEAS